MCNFNIKVLCISDSFGLPREGVPYDDTWIVKLKKRFKGIDFIPLFRRNMTTNDLDEHNYFEYLKYYYPDYIYLQLGICDCAPRYIRTNSLLYQIMCMLPPKISSIGWKIIKIRGRKLNCINVSLDKFYLNLSRYINEGRSINIKKIFICKIGIPADNMIASSPNILKSIEKYNKVIDQLYEENTDILEVIHPFANGDKSNYVADGYHPNHNGHRLIYESLDQALSKCQI